jgi:formate hydrogenlyase subunit 4
LLRLLAPFFMEWVKRKVDARVERRVGPPLLQPVYDWVKLWGKEMVVPRDAGVFFRLGPWLLFFMSIAAVYLAAFRPPWALLYLLALLSAATLVKMLLAHSVGSPFTVLGMGRLGSVKLALDPAFPLAFLAPAFVWGFQMNWPPAAAIFFPIAFIASLAELELPPFDLSHARTEIVAGWKTELSGRLLALVNYAEDAHWLAVSLMLASLFGPSLLLLKAFGIFMLMDAVSVVLARMHIKKAIKFLSFLNVLAMAEVVLCLSLV